LRPRSGSRGVVLLLLIFGILLALGPARAGTPNGFTSTSGSRCCWMVALDSKGSTVTDYGPKLPDPPISPAAVSGNATFSWSFSVRMILGVKFAAGHHSLTEPPSAVEARRIARNRQASLRGRSTQRSPMSRWIIFLYRVRTRGVQMSTARSSPPKLPLW
jgi:hypothetical protein